MLFVFSTQGEAAPAKQAREETSRQSTSSAHVVSCFTVTHLCSSSNLLSCGRSVSSQASVREMVTIRPLTVAPITHPVPKVLGALLPHLPAVVTQPPSSIVSSVAMEVMYSSLDSGKCGEVEEELLVDVTMVEGKDAPLDDIPFVVDDDAGDDGKEGMEGSVGWDDEAPHDSPLSQRRNRIRHQRPQSAVMTNHVKSPLASLPMSPIRKAGSTPVSRPTSAMPTARSTSVSHHSFGLLSPMSSRPQSAARTPKAALSVSTRPLTSLSPSTPHKSTAAAKLRELVSSANHRALLGVKIVPNAYVPPVPSIASPQTMEKLSKPRQQRPNGGWCDKPCCEQYFPAPVQPAAVVLRPLVHPDTLVCSRECCKAAVETRAGDAVREYTGGPPGVAGTIQYEGDFCDRRVGWEMQQAAAVKIQRRYRRWNSNNLFEVHNKL